jgi:hypothetical protein
MMMTTTETVFETRTEPLFDPGDIREFLESRPFFREDPEWFYGAVASRLEEYLSFFGVNWHILKPIPADVLRRAVLAVETDDILDNVSIAISAVRGSLKSIDGWTVERLTELKALANQIDVSSVEVRGKAELD